MPNQSNSKEIKPSSIKPNPNQGKTLFFDLIRKTGLSLIGVFCLCYAVFISRFSELHINLKFLNFPIFVGELLLGCCLILFFIRYRLSPFRLESWHYAMLAYTSWVLVKAFWGYISYGPLAFRNAALFYYVLFAVIAYYFFRKEWFSQKIIIGLLIILAAIKITLEFSPYFLLTSLGLFLVLLLSVKNKWFKCIFLALFFYFLLHFSFFKDSKSGLMSNMAASTTLFTCLLFSVFPGKKKYKIFFLFLGFVAIVAGFLRYSWKNQVQSLTAPISLMEQYRRYDAYITERKKTYHQKKIVPSLYNPEGISLSNDLFLRVGSPQKTINNTNALEQLKKDELVSIIDYNAENLKISVKQILKKYKEGMLASMKEVVNDDFLLVPSGEIDPLKEQTGVIKIIEDLTQSSTLKVLSVIDAQRLAAVEEMSRFLQSQAKDPMPSIQAREALKKIIALSPLEGPIAAAISQATDAIYQVNVEFMRNIRNILKKNGVDVSYLEKGTQKNQESSIQEVTGMRLPVESKAKAPLETPDFILKGGAPEGRPLGEEQGNMLFRLFIWRDMLRDMIEQPFSFLSGVSFGKPQRSISLEIPISAYGEWIRDGWITPHNSYFHMIYRGGIVGLGMIFGLLAFFSRLIRLFLRIKSVVGIILVSILAYWLTISNFLMILELPHYAIPFWSLLGVTAAYAEAKYEEVYSPIPKES